MDHNIAYFETYNQFFMSKKVDKSEYLKLPAPLEPYLIKQLTSSDLIWPHLTSFDHIYKHISRSTRTLY